MEIDWQDIYLKLKAFSHALAESKSWFRGKDAPSFYAGKEGHDYAMEAIMKHIEHPEKFDPERGDLLKFLKFNLVRTSIKNDVNREENKLTKDIFREDDDGDDDSVPYAERLLPYTMASFSDDYDYEELKKYIEDRVKEDPEAEKVYMGKILEMTREEIIEDCEWKSGQYDNANRRLKTIANRAVAYFKATKVNEQQQKSKQV